MSLSLLSQDRLDILAALAKQCLPLRGQYVECGVYMGGSALHIAEAIKGHDRRLYLYDRFGLGLPAPGPHDLHKRGAFGGNDFEAVYAMMPDHVSMYQGLFKDTLNMSPQYHVSFAHIDADLYKSTMDCLHALYRRMLPGGVMIFDDYGGVMEPGVKMALQEFLADKPEAILPLVTEQAVVFKV